jgi:two-component system OmpR family sensor kinase
MSSGRIGQAWGSLRGLPDRTPLRVKMVTAVLALVAIALGAISFVGIAFLKDYLLNGADAQLQELYQNAPRLQYGGHNAATVSPEPWLYEALLPNEGLQVVKGYLPLGTSGPTVTTDASWLSAATPTYITVPAQSGSELWRVVAYPGQTFQVGSTQQIGTLIVGIDVTSIYNTIGNLIRIDVIVSVIVLIALFIVGIAVVRASLRPLTDIEKTAGAIAAGDLTRRVPDLDPRTEVGRLGRSLNTMLSQIETAFDARAESELAARRSEERMRQFVADASHELRTPLTAIRGFAEYYRQRGGVAEIPGAAGSLPPGSDAAALAAEAGTSAADTGMPADETGAAAAEAGTSAADTGTAAAETGTAAAETGAAVAPRHGSNAEPADRTRSGPLPRADLDRIMQRVEQESSRMGGLVEDMLLLARLDQQRPLELATVDMLTLAADAVHDARMIAPDRSINLTVGSGAALLVLGDEARLRQVVGNLINNAISHTPEGSPIEVRVRLGSLDEWRPAAAAGRRAGANSAGQAAFAVASPSLQPFPAVVFEIADQGPGLTQSQAEHVFERFYRADQARTRQSGGAGLGLAIVAALVAVHGGNVWVESPPGGGAIFRIAIPLAPEARNSGPDFDDGTDPDILDAHRGTLSPPSAVAAGPGHADPGHADPGHAEPPGAAGSASPGRPAAPPLPKRRPGYSGHMRA